MRGRPGAELAFEAMAKVRRWTLLKHGWPDYLVTFRRQVWFVEVKAKYDKLRPQQLMMLGALERAGLNVAVWDEASGKFYPWHRHTERRRNRVRVPRSAREARKLASERRALEVIKTYHREAPTYDPVLGC